jgi:hypothetical protein
MYCIFVEFWELTMRKFSLLSVGLAFLSFSVLAPATQADVTVRKSGATLILTGNAAPDWVEIYGVAPNVVAVSIDGDEEVYYEDVQHIRVRLGRGADYLLVQDVEISGNLDINMGGDLDDFSEIVNSTIRGNLTSAGASDSRLVESTVGKNLTLNSGVAYDVDGDGLTMLVENVFVAGRATIKGDGRLGDSLQIVESSFSRDLTINVGGGADEVSMIDNIVGRNLTVDGGAGTDLFQSSNNMVGGRITLRRFEFEI